MISLRAQIPSLASWLVLLAIVARGLVPAGFMPDIRHGAPLKIEICTAGNGLATILVPADKRPEHKQEHRDACPYAPAFAQTLLTVFTTLPFVKILAPAILDRATGNFVSPFFKAYFSQGPPASLRG